MIPLPWILLAAVVGWLGTVGLSFYEGTQYSDTQWAAVIEKNKADAERTLKEAVQKTLTVERAAAKLKDQMEMDHAQQRRIIDDALATNRRLAAELGGLRDPGRRLGGDTAVPATPNSARVPAGDPATGQLSDAASSFLLEFAYDADRAAEYAGACKHWLKVSGQQP